MLKMIWMTDNEGRLAAKWTELNQPVVTPSYLREKPMLQTAQPAGPATGKAFLDRPARKYHKFIDRLLRPGGADQDGSPQALAQRRTLS
jgi:hypothetical protein